MVAAVEGYLEAVAEADSVAAMGHLYVVPDSKTLLTDEVLTASAQAAPISGIEATITSTGADGYTAKVQAIYTLGNQKVKHVYEVNDWDDDGVWQIVDGTFEVELGEKLAGLGATINGQAVGSGTVALLPGSYTVALGTSYYTLGDAQTLKVYDSDSADPNQIQPVLTDEGKEVFRQAVRNAAAACLGAKTLVAGCGLDLPGTLADGTVLDEGTITRTVAPETQAALDALDPVLEETEQAVATAPELGVVDVTANCTIGEQTGMCQVFGAPALPRVSVLMTDPELPVTWG